MSTCLEFGSTSFDPLYRLYDICTMQPRLPQMSLTGPYHRIIIIKNKNKKFIDHVFVLRLLLLVWTLVGVSLSVVSDQNGDNDSYKTVTIGHFHSESCWPAAFRFGTFKILVSLISESPQIGGICTAYNFLHTCVSCH